MTRPAAMPAAGCNATDTDFSKEGAVRDRVEKKIASAQPPCLRPSLHSVDGTARSARSFRGLTEAAIAVGGSFFLTYHRYASASQVAQAYPEFRQFLAKKRVFDPEQRFQSEWYRHYRDAFAAMPETPTARGTPAR